MLGSSQYPAAVSARISSGHDPVGISVGRLTTCSHWLIHYPVPPPTRSDNRDAAKRSRRRSRPQSNFPGGRSGHIDAHYHHSDMPHLQPLRRYNPHLSEVSEIFHPLHRLVV